MKIAIDLRCLNFPVYTGVNVYTLHLLHEINNLKKVHKNLDFIAIGLKKNRFEELIKEFIFLEKLFDTRIDLNTYLKLPKWLKDYKWLNLLLLLKLKITDNIFSNKVQEFDYLILPQPRPIIINPQTKLISIFHDLFGVLDKNGLTISQRLLEDPKIYKRIANCSHKILVDSISTGKDLQELLNHQSQKIQLVYPGIANISSFSISRVPKIDTEALLKNNYYLALSGIEHRKNWHNLLLAHKFLQSNYPDFDLDLVLAGTVVNGGYYQELIALIKKYEIQKVAWIIKPSESTKKNLIKNSLFIAYPSFYEGFGFPILEAFEMNKAVVTSRISSMPEIAKDGAMYVNPFNLKDIAAGIYILFKDSDFRKQLESNTKKNLDNFSWSEIYNFFESTVC